MISLTLTSPNRYAGRYNRALPVIKSQISRGSREKDRTSDTQRMYSFLINYGDIVASLLNRYQSGAKFLDFLSSPMRERRGECREWLATELPGAFYLVVSILSSGISIPASHWRVTDPYLGDTLSHPGWRFLGHTSISEIHESRRVPAGDPSSKILRALFLAPCIRSYNTDHTGGCDTFGR